MEAAQIRADNAMLDGARSLQHNCANIKKHGNGSIDD